LLNEDSCYTIYQFCRHCLHLGGDFAECGVYRGGSAFLIASTLADSGIRRRELHLFDTFEGMPSTANDDPSGIKEGQFGDTSLTAVKDYLRDFPFLSFHPGYIPATLESVMDRRFAFVHIDCDLHLTTKDCLEFFYNRMVTGGVMIFDDYGYPIFRDSVKRAVDEFFCDKEETPISLRTGQCIILKL
jgi:O-methyltransferase